MESTLTKIADAEKVYQKIKRIAFEIAEDNYDETEIVLAGICKATEGYVFAELLYKELSKISKAHILLTHIELDKNDPGNSVVELNLTEEEKNVIHKGKQTKLHNRLAWTRYYLKMKGYIENSDKSNYVLTEKGKDRIDNL